MGPVANPASVSVAVEGFINNRNEVRMTLTGDIIAAKGLSNATNPFVEIYVQKERYELVYKTEVRWNVLAYPKTIYGLREKPHRVCTDLFRS